MSVLAGGGLQSSKVVVLMWKTGLLIVEVVEAPPRGRNHIFLG